MLTVGLDLRDLVGLDFTLEDLGEEPTTRRDDIIISVEGIDTSSSSIISADTCLGIETVAFLPDFITGL